MTDVTRPTAAAAERILSVPRYQAYSVASNSGHDAAIALYEWNLQISSALFEELHVLEVALRNAIDTILTACEVPSSVSDDKSRCWWFNNSAFITSKGLAPVNAAIQMVVASDTRKNGRPSRGAVLAALSFGYWVKLFGKDYEQLWRSHLRKAFPYSSKGTKRKPVHVRLQGLQNLRNRIAHHEPIHQLELQNYHENCLEVLGWLDLDARSWVESWTRVPALLAARPSPPEAVAAIVSDPGAWDMYQQAKGYICRPRHFSRTFSHIGFWDGQQVKPEVARVLHRVEVEVDGPSIAKFVSGDGPYDRQVAEIIKSARSSGRAEPGAYELFVLTRHGDTGHIGLPGEANGPVGRPSTSGSTHYVQISELVPA